MNNLQLYRLILKLLPRPKAPLQAVRQRMDAAQLARYQAILAAHWARGGALALFDSQGLHDHLVYGQAREGLPVTEQTAFRLASVSKTVSAAGILALVQQGAVDLHADADIGLPYSLRHPQAPDTAITLAMLLSHTAGIADSPAYTSALTDPVPASRLLPVSHTAHLPGLGCEYSNLGLGLAGCVVEAQTGLSFEQAMAQALFEPLKLQASYYPQRLKAPLADAWRVLPPRRRPNLSGAARQAAPLPGWDRMDLEQHYLLAHGGCCMDVGSLARLGQVLMASGFLSSDSLAQMRKPWASLGERDPHLKQGLGLFILEDTSICQQTLYGHQGMAYGAVQMLFFDPASGRGILSLTTGASEARQHILTDLNRALLTEWMRHG